MTSGIKTDMVCTDTYKQTLPWANGNSDVTVLANEIILTPPNSNEVSMEMCLTFCVYSHNYPPPQDYAELSCNCLTLNDSMMYISKVFLSVLQEPAREGRVSTLGQDNPAFCKFFTVLKSTFL